MSESLRTVAAITMFVEDPRRSKGFYAGVFGAEVVNEDEHSVAFAFDNLVVNLLASTEAPELIDPARVATGESGSRFQLTVPVDDTDAVCAELASRGVELLNGPVDRPWGLRTAAFADPDGHVWEVASAIPD